jgi:GT2 family glycosyltransferase
MIELSISIVNFNTKDYLRRCLNSIQENLKGINYEIIVVDNNSDDGSAEMLKEEFSSSLLIVNKQNLGAAKAKNQSFAIARGKYILILDSDIEILPGSIQKLCDFLENNPQAGIVGPRVLFPGYRPQHSCNHKFPDILSSFLNRVFFFSRFRYVFYRSRIGAFYLKVSYAKQRECFWLGGMCLLARRELINRLGGIDENFFIYYDDTDLCLRARKSGWRVYYLPVSGVIHHQGKGTAQLSHFLYPKIAAAEIYFFKKHYGSFQAKICALFIQFGMILRLALSLPGLFFGAQKDYFSKRIKSYRQTFLLAAEELYAKAD